MKQANFGLLFLLALIILPFTINAEDDYEPSELPSLVSEFGLSYQVLDEMGLPIQGPVAGVATIKISEEEPLSANIYTLTLYINRSFVTQEAGISLPYDFKWNFKGLSNGEYELLFILKSAAGKIGVLRVNLTVQN